MARPYQPSLLRALHGLTALLVLACWLSGLFVYSRYDGRWGRLSWIPSGGAADWIDLHGSFGVLLWPLALLFGGYALTLGLRRLQRPANAVALLALTLAVASGKLMQEDWLRQGELHHLAYSLHLLGWLVMAAAVLAHLGALLRLGGVPLLRSMLSPRLRAGDQPRDWPAQLRRHWSRGR